jgi:hypothetical protein
MGSGSTAKSFVAWWSLFVPAAGDFAERDRKEWETAKRTER